MIHTEVGAEAAGSAVLRALVDRMILALGPEALATSVVACTVLRGLLRRGPLGISLAERSQAQTLFSVRSAPVDHMPQALERAAWGSWLFRKSSSRFVRKVFISLELNASLARLASTRLTWASKGNLTVVRVWLDCTLMYWRVQALSRAEFAMRASHLWKEARNAKFAHQGNMHLLLVCPIVSWRLQVITSPRSALPLLPRAT